MKRLASVVLCLLAVLVLSCAWAQEAVTLRYKFVPNRVDAMSMTGNGTIPMTINPGPEAGVPGMGMDIMMDMTMRSCQVCKSVDDKGVGSLETTIPLMAIHTTLQVADQPVEMMMKWEKGVLSNTVNGQSLPADENIQKLTQLLCVPMKSTQTPLGVVKPDSESTKMLASLFNQSGLNSLDWTQVGALTSALPENPVKVGDTWTIQSKLPTGQALLQGTSKFKLAAIENFEGAKVARIEGTATLMANGQMGATTPMGMPANINITNMNIVLNFVNRLDIAKGIIVTSDVNMVQNMDMMISMGAQNMHIPASIENGQMTMQIRKIQ